MLEKRVSVEAGEELQLENDVVGVFLLWHRGDVLNSTALLPELSKRHGRKLVYLTTAPCAPLLEYNPHIKKIIVIESDLPDSLTRKTLKQIDQLRYRYLSGPARIYDLHMPVNLRTIHVHIVELWARALGIFKPLSELKPAYYTNAGPEKMSEFSGALVLGNGGLSSSKHWPLSRWRSFLKQLKSRHPNLQLVQLGSKSDPRIADARDLRGQTSIDETYQVLKQARACVTNDSFLSHLSCAANCPTSVIFGPTSASLFRPLGDGLQSALGGRSYCANLLHGICEMTGGRLSCLEFPSVADVLQSALSILADG